MAGKIYLQTITQTKLENSREVQQMQPFEPPGKLIEAVWQSAGAGVAPAIAGRFVGGLFCFYDLERECGTESEDHKIVGNDWGH